MLIPTKPYLCNDCFVLCKRFDGEVVLSLMPPVLSLSPACLKFAITCRFCCPLYYNLIFGASLDELNTKPDNLFQITQSQVVQAHPGINKFCLNVCLMFWVCVRFQWENQVINQFKSSGFQELSPYKHNSFASYHNTNELTKVKIWLLYCENILISILLETLCNQDTLTMNL